MAMTNCPECKSEVSNKAVFCPNCGYGIAASESNRAQSKNASEPLPESKESNKSNVRTVIAVCVLVLLLAGLAGIVYYFVYPLMSKAAENLKSVAEEMGEQVLVDKQETIDPSMVWSYPFSVKRDCSVEVTVTELFGKNIEFKVTNNGPEIYNSGVIAGGKKVNLNCKKGECVLVITNGNILESKTVHVKIVVK